METVFFDYGGAHLLHSHQCQMSEQQNATGVQVLLFRQELDRRLRRRCSVLEPSCEAMHAAACLGNAGSARVRARVARYAYPLAAEISRPRHRVHAASDRGNACVGKALLFAVGAVEFK